MASEGKPLKKAPKVIQLSEEKHSYKVDASQKTTTGSIPVIQGLKVSPRNDILGSGGCMAFPICSEASPIENNTSEHTNIKTMRGNSVERWGYFMRKTFMRNPFPCTSARANPHVFLCISCSQSVCPGGGF